MTDIFSLSWIITWKHAAVLIATTWKPSYKSGKKFTIIGGNKIALEIKAKKILEVSEDE